MGPSQTHIQWVPAFFPRDSVRGVMFTPPSSAEVGSGWSCNCTPPPYYFTACIGGGILYAEVIHSSGKKLTLEYIRFLLKNKIEEDLQEGPP